MIFFGWMGNSCVTTKLGPEQNQPKFSVRFYALCSAIRHFISTVVSHREKMCLFTTTLCRQLGVFLTRHHHHMSYTVYKIFKSHSWNYVMLNCATQKDNSIDAQNLNHACPLKWFVLVECRNVVYPVPATGSPIPKDRVPAVAINGWHVARHWAAVRVRARLEAVLSASELLIPVCRYAICGDPVSVDGTGYTTKSKVLDFGPWTQVFGPCPCPRKPSHSHCPCFDHRVVVNIPANCFMSICHTVRRIYSFSCIHYKIQKHTGLTSRWPI